MQCGTADLLPAPWALLPNRLGAMSVLLRGTPSRLLALMPVAATSARRRATTGAIAVLPFYGVAVPRTNAYGEALGLISLWRFTQAFRAALADEIYRSRTRKPIFAIANSFAASGAYWIASAASEFYVSPGGRSAASVSMTFIPIYRRGSKRSALPRP